MSTANLSETLLAAFGDYRAEWGTQQFGRFFVRPPFMASLEAIRPTMLIGGRGTGKTTALTALRYDNRLSTHQAVDDRFFGIYVKMKKLAVSAFRGSWATPEHWQLLFSHYFNLLVLSEAARLRIWHLSVTHEDMLTAGGVAELGYLLSADIADPLAFDRIVRRALNDLQLYVNNAGRVQQPILSPPEVPLRALATAIAGGPTGRALMICVDEYENLTEEQQSVVNTYIKQADDQLTYKVGMKSGGLRTRNTLDAEDPLITPADFAEVTIATEAFESFADDVARTRLQFAHSTTEIIPADPALVFPRMPPDEEALHLGGARVIERVRGELRHTASVDQREWFENLRAHEQCLVGYLAAGGEQSVSDVVTDAMKSSEQWKNSINNYVVPTMFWLSKGRKGARIQKVFSGFDTFVKLSAGNIRFLLELLDESCKQALESYVGGTFVVSALDQTRAAQLVGARRLDQLESVSEHGVAIKRVVLALGRVFMELARRPGPGMPEATMFVLKEESPYRARAEALLHEAVAHQALLMGLSTKATKDEEMKVPEYRLHPLFAPLFGFSHRRKRRVTIDPADILALADDPKAAIRRMLSDRDPEEPVPTQLALYDDFFAGRRRSE